jgi:signal transduction histidine kinase
MKAAALALAVLSLTTSAWALDPGRAPSQYVLRSWGATSLHSNSVHSIRQTPDGYLWLGTSAGAVRYDGARFVLFGAAATPEIDGGVSALAVGPSGALYLGTTSGAVLEHRDDGFRKIWAPSRSGNVYSLAAARDGSLWMAFDAQPPIRFQNGTARGFLAEAQTLSLRTIAEAPDGALWIGTRDGLLRAKGDTFTRQAVTEDTVQALRFDRAGVLWIGTPHGLYRLEDGRSRRFTVKDGLAADDVTAVLDDRDGNLWVGTAHGLTRITSGRLESVLSTAGLVDDDVRCLFEDREGTLWVGTGDGLASIRDGAFVTYGLEDDKVTAVIGAADGSAWVGTASGQVARLLADGRRDAFVLPGAGTGRERVVTLHEARDGAVWIATENGRLFRVSGRAVVERTPRDARNHQRVTCLFEDDGGLALFVTGRGSEPGLVRLVDGRYVAFTDGHPALGFVHSARRATDGGPVWLATTQGLAALQGMEVKRFREGLAQPRVRWTSPDDEGGLWLATAGGLAHFKDGTFRLVTVREGLPENYLRVVLPDGLGHLWAAGMGTLFRLDEAEVRDVLAGRSARVAPVLFDTSDGLRTTEALLGNAPAFRAADGRLWFATAKGVAVVDPRLVRTDDPAPPARIESVVVDGRDGVAAEYAPGRGEVAIGYTTSSLSERIRFRHRLEGFDADWVESGERRSAYYSNLPPGRYRFLVEASNRHGVWNGSPTGLAFRLRPPFHRTPLFYALAIVLTAAAAAAVHHLRVRQMQARFAGVIGERTRIARELHDTLAQGVAGIRLQVETGLETLSAQPEVARQHLRVAEAMARSSIAEVRRSIWVLRAQAAKGSEGLAASFEDGLRQLTADSAVPLRVEVAGRPRVLDPELEHHLLRVTHELVLNALRHAAPAHLGVRLAFGDDGVQLAVEDDGRGFAPAAYLAGAGGDHFGLLGVHERVVALGGSLDVRSEPGQGTKIVCRLPYRG